MQSMITNKGMAIIPTNHSLIDVDSDIVNGMQYLIKHDKRLAPEL